MATSRYFRRSRVAGFSLLEVIAAILLLGIAFGAVMNVAASATQLTGHARDLTRVAMWADTTLDAAGRDTPLHVGTQEGRYDATHRWRMAVTAQDPVPAHRADLHLYRVDLDVYSGEGRNERHEHFATLRLQDEVAPAAASSAMTPMPTGDG